MNKRKLYITTITLWVFFSCTNEAKQKKNDNCVLNITELMKKDSNRLIVNDRTENGVITQLIDKTNDSVITGAYYFYPDGLLKSYKFFGLPSTYQYNEEYDTLGNITLIEGSPLMAHFYRKIDDTDMEFTFLFSTLHKDYKYLTIKTNTGIEFPVELLDNATFTNVKSATFKLPVAKSFHSTIIYSECQLFNTCLNKKWSLKDTTSFKDKPL